MDEATIENINETFDIFDKNKEEKIPSESLGSVLRWLGFNPTDRELKKFTLKYDRSGAGYFKKDAIYEIYSEKKNEPDTVHEFIEALNLFDTDHDGKIPITELRWALT